MTNNPQILSVKFSPEARNDLADIRRYTFDQFGEDQVDAYLSKLAEGIKRVRDMPGIGRRHNEIPNDLLLVKLEQHYLIYQHVDDQIYIVRILFARSNLGRYFE
ncbi:MAG: type II toxin-antitoxin system RelE/ParE family toxin [Chloroflexi bacterium]|nr:type II toxin-antitoxin system RelE/ParE family toxin [Chloroflexota bacterium]MYE27874.1 type II toxin-antitoxin system RelE/ParE family toxin [Chloroflexota bacterium]